MKKGGKDKNIVGSFFKLCSYLNLGEEGLYVLLLGVQEPVGEVVGRRVGQQVDGRQSGLLPARDKHDDRFARGVLDDGVVGRLGHGYDPGRVVRHVEALDVELERDGADVGVEVEGGVGPGTQPLRHVLGEDVS